MHESDEGSANSATPPDPIRERREQIKAHLLALGLTVTQWAEANGYKRKLVYKVLSGQSKANFGVGHEIAVKLGIKDNDFGGPHG